MEKGKIEEESQNKGGVNQKLHYLLKHLPLFAGFGGADFGLELSSINFKTIGFSEIEPNAIKCHGQNHKAKCLGSVVDIDPNKLEDIDLITAGFPCQDVSIAGNRDLGKGRTTLFNEIIRIAAVKKPRWMLLENVEGLLSTSFWFYVKNELARIGYSIRYKLLYSKNHGIPQNRPRLWILCDREGFEPFKSVFPEKEQLKLNVRDILEDEVDNSYYLTPKNFEAMEKGLLRRGKKFENNFNKDIAKTLMCSNPKRALHDTSIICHSKQPRTSTSGKCGTGHLSRNDGISYTIDTGNSQFIEYNQNYRVLTPKECFRLMGFLNDEINLDGLSKNACYKLAGNGWDINLVSKIFKTWLKPQLEKGE